MSDMTLWDESFIVPFSHTLTSDSVRIHVLERKLTVLSQMDWLGIQTVATWVFVGILQVRDICWRSRSVVTIGLEWRDDFERNSEI